MPRKITCKTGLKKNEISKNVFDREVNLCKKLSQKNKGKCGWGKCKNCGVLFLLHKFYKGILIDDKAEIKEIRKNILGVWYSGTTLNSLVVLNLFWIYYRFKKDNAVRIIIFKR